MPSDNAYPASHKVQYVEEVQLSQANPHYKQSLELVK